MEKSKIEVQDFTELDFEILNEGDLGQVRAGTGGTMDPGKPASKNPVGGVLPEACDGAS